MKSAASPADAGQPVRDSTIPDVLYHEHNHRPRWLLTPYPEHTWTVYDTVHKRHRTIRFDVALPNGRTLLDYPHLLESIKRVVYGVRTGPLMEVESGSVQATIASNLLTLARWMTSNNIDKFEQITPADVREYAELAAYGAHNILNTEGVLAGHLQKIATRAGFDPDDPPKTARHKAIASLPTLSRGPLGHTVYLHRSALLREAGLDGLTFGGICPLTILLDNFEQSLGLNLNTNVRRRLARNLSLDELDDTPVSEEHVRRFLMSFDYLYRHRRYLHDAIQQNPFPASSPRAEAQRLGKVIGRTQTVPIPQAVTMIERSIRWVVDYSSDLLELNDFADSILDMDRSNKGEEKAWEALREKLQTFKPGITGPGCPYPILPLQRQAHETDPFDEILDASRFYSGMSLPNALRFLMVACAVVIAAFSARRATEICGLKAGCIELDEAGKPWLRIYIAKTVQEESVIPIPQVVAEAVRVLERLSARARTQTGLPFLFQMNLPGTNTTLGISGDGAPNFPFGRFLRCFGYFLDIPALEDGSRWTFKPHQFRRFFAILYIWVYELGDWGALSYHLRHFNPEMTRRYVSDPELGHILALANKEHTAQVMANAALGKTNIGGALGSRLKLAAKRLYDRMSVRVHIVPERVFIQRLTRFVERTGVTLRALPWGFCGCNPDNASDAADCALPTQERTQPRIPDIASATPALCQECYFSVRSDVFLPFLKGTLAMHQSIAGNQLNPRILRNASSALISIFTNYIASLTPSKS